MTLPQHLSFLQHIFDFPALSSLMNQKRPKKTLALRLDYSSDNPPEGMLNVLVPQAIDKGVQYWGDHSVHH